MFARSFLRNRPAVVGTLIIFSLVTVAILAPTLAPYDPTVIDLAIRLNAPSGQHWLGTDELGRDILSRIMLGSRITLLITSVAVCAALPMGTLLGLLAAFYRGRTDMIISRLVDLMMAVPGFLLAIAIIAILGVGTVNVIVAVGVDSIPAFARIARGAALRATNEDYVLAARALGAKEHQIMFHHVAPNIFAPLLVQASLRLATAILSAASLSFLGLGPQPPTPEWGAMLATGRNFVYSAPFLVITPGLAIMLAALGFNLTGDGLREALDPRLRR